MTGYVLIGCEESGAVSNAFAALGFDAWSCDLLPTRGGGNHLQMDVLDAIQLRQWDFIGLHPVCTAVTVSGNHVYAAGKPKHQERLDACKWIQNLWNLMKRHARMGYLENPVGCIPRYTDLPRPTYIQPYDFGEDASKKTGLWLYNLPPLRETEFFPPRWVNDRHGNRVPRWSNQTDSGQNRLGPSETRARERAETYAGVATAMADQWSRFI